MAPIGEQARIPCTKEGPLFEIDRPERRLRRETSSMGKDERERAESALKRFGGAPGAI